MLKYEEYFRNSSFLQHLYKNFIGKSSDKYRKLQVYLVSNTKQVLAYIDKGLPSHRDNVKIISIAPKKIPHIITNVLIIGVLLTLWYACSQSFGSFMGKAYLPSAIWTIITLVFLDTVFTVTIANFSLIRDISRRVLPLIEGLLLTSVCYLTIQFAKLGFPQNHFVCYMFLGMFVMTTFAIFSKRKWILWTVLVLGMFAIVEQAVFGYRLFSLIFVHIGVGSRGLINSAPLLWMMILGFYTITVAMSVGYAHYRNNNQMLNKDGFFYSLNGFGKLEVKNIRILKIGCIPLFIVMSSVSFFHQPANTFFNNFLWFAPTNQDLFFVFALGFVMLFYLTITFRSWKSLYFRCDVNLRSFFRRDDNKLLIVHGVKNAKHIEKIPVWKNKNKNGSLMILIMSTMELPLWKNNLRQVKERFTDAVLLKDLEDNIEELDAVIPLEPKQSNATIIFHKEGGLQDTLVNQFAKKYKIISEVDLNKKTINENYNFFDKLIYGAGCEIKNGKIRSLKGKKWGALLAIIPLLLRLLMPFFNSVSNEIKNNEVVRGHFEPLLLLMNDIQEFFTYYLELMLGENFLYILAICTFCSGAFIFWLYLRGETLRSEEYKYHFLRRWLRKKCRASSRWYFFWVRKPRALILHNIDVAPPQILSYMRDVTHDLKKEKLRILATWNTSRTPNIPSIYDENILVRNYDNISQEEFIRILDDQKLLHQISPLRIRELYQSSFGIPENIAEGIAIAKKFDKNKWQQWKLSSLEIKKKQLSKDIVKNTEILMTYSHYHSSQSPSFSGLLGADSDSENHKLAHIFMKYCNKINQLSSSYDKEGVAVVFDKWHTKINRPRLS